MGQQDVLFCFRLFYKEMQRGKGALGASVHQQRLWMSLTSMTNGATVHQRNGAMIAEALRVDFNRLKPRSHAGLSWFVDVEPAG